MHPQAVWAVKQESSRKIQAIMEERLQPENKKKGEVRLNKMNLIPTEKSKIEAGLSNLTLFIFGEPKIGKSSFCSQIPRALFLNTDAGLGGLEVFSTPIITDWSQVVQVVNELSKQENKEKFDVIIIDTIEKLYLMAMDHVCSQLNVSYPGDKGAGFGKGWKILNEQMYRVITKIRSLGYGVVMISHTKEMEVEEPIKVKYVPNLGDSVRKVLTGMSDMILFFRGEPQMVKNSQTGEVRRVSKRVIRTRSSVYYEAGCRQKGGNILADPIPLDYGVFRKELDRVCGIQETNK
jgi:hypothetical protein